MGESSVTPTMADLIEAARDRPIRVFVPLPSSVALEDTEVIRAYVDAEIQRAIEEDFDLSA